MPHSRYRFYVYLLLDPAGQPFYIGKGSGGRILDHEREARSGHDCPKCDAIRAIWSAGGQIVKTIVFETDDEQEALVREAELIEQYGLTTLTNKVAGGRGTRGNTFQIRATETFTTKTRRHEGLQNAIKSSCLRAFVVI